MTNLSPLIKSGIWFHPNKIGLSSMVMERLHARTQTRKVVHNTLWKKSIYLLTDTHLWVAVFLLPILSCTSPPLSSKTRPGSQHLPSSTTNTTGRPWRVLRPTYWDKRITLNLDQPLLLNKTNLWRKTTYTACRPSRILTLFRMGGGIFTPPNELSQISEILRRPKACAFFICD